MLGFAAIFSISFFSGLFIVILLLVMVCLILKRKRDAEHVERCRNLLRKFNSSGPAAGNFPYCDATYTKTNPPGQRFTEFVLPGRLYGDAATAEERKSLISMRDPIMPETLDPSLYGDEKNLKSSEEARTKPHVKFSVSYNEINESLDVFLDLIQNLLLDTNDEAHCTVCVMPSRQELTSQIAVKKDKFLVIGENFRFGIYQKDLVESYLLIKLFRQTSQSKLDCVGSVFYNLQEVSFTQPTTYWKKLTAPDANLRQITERPAGQILLRIGYTPSNETLKIMLLRARNLLEVGEVSQPPDPYVRVAIVHDGTTIKKKKTSKRLKSFNPTFNQPISFKVPLTMLPRTEIKIYVVHDSRGSSSCDGKAQKQVIGFVEIGPESRREQREHWNDLMSERQNTRWHHLKISSEFEFNIPEIESPPES